MVTQFWLEDEFTCYQFEPKYIDNRLILTELIFLSLAFNVFTMSFSGKKSYILPT